MNAIFVVLLALIGISSVVADLSGFWSANDLNRLVKSHQKTLASSSSSSKDIYYSLQLLSVSQNVDSFCQCDAYGHRVPAAVSLIEKYHAVKSNDLCNCNFKPSNELLTQIEDSLQSEDFASLASALILGKQFGKLTSNSQEAAFSKLREIVFVEGEISFPFSDADGTLSKLHLLLDVLSAFKEDETVQAFAADVFEKVFRLLPGGDGDALSDATLIAPLSGLSSKKLRIDKAALKVSAETLIGLKYSTDPETAFKAYKSLDIIRTYKAAPYYASIKKSYFSSGEDLSFAAEVYDVLGNTLAIDEVELVSLKVIGKDSFVVQNVKEKGSGVIVAADKLTAGRYGVNMAVNLAEKLTTIKFQTVVVVTEKVEIKDIAAGITDSKQFTSDLTSVPVQNSFFGLEVSASAQDVLHVSFKISNVSKKPHQAFVRLANKETSESVVFVANKVGDGEYHLAIAVHEEVDAFSYESGDYVLSIMVADAAISNQQEWTLGSVSVKFPTKPVVNLPLYAKSLLHTSDTTLKPLPEIEHQMRPPSKRASPFMSGLFTVLSVLPLVVFVGFILSLKPNLARLNSLASVAFVVCLIAIVALYSGYWLAVEGVSFYDTIKYLCFLLPLTIIVGRYSLNSIASTRLSKDKQN